MQYNGDMYNQYKKNETDDLRTWPKFEQGMHCYVPMGAIFVELGHSNTKEKHECELALVVVLQECRTIEV